MTTRCLYTQLLCCWGKQGLFGFLGTQSWDPQKMVFWRFLGRLFYPQKGNSSKWYPCLFPWPSIYWLLVAGTLWIGSDQDTANAWGTLLFELQWWQQTLGLNLTLWILNMLCYIHRNFLELFSGILKFSLKIYFRLTLKIFQHAGKRNSEFIHFPCPGCKSALPQWGFQSFIMFPSPLLCGHLTEAGPWLHIYIFHFFK